jgi:hypothetical protein
MDIDSMTPDELRRLCRDLMRENETLRRRFGPRPPPFSRAAEAVLDGMSSDEVRLVVGLAGAIG